MGEHTYETTPRTLSLTSSCYPRYPLDLYLKRELSRKAFQSMVTLLTTLHPHIWVYQKMHNLPHIDSGPLISTLPSI